MRRPRDAYPCLASRGGGGVAQIEEKYEEAFEDMRATLHVMAAAKKESADFLANVPPEVPLANFQIPARVASILRLSVPLRHESHQAHLKAQLSDWM